MIAIRLPQKDGAALLHTFQSVPSELTDDLIQIWRECIHDVAGYTVDPDAPNGCSIISLSKTEWKQLMIDRHGDDCIDAVKRLAVRAGMLGEKKKTKSKKKTDIKTDNETDGKKAVVSDPPKPQTPEDKPVSDRPAK